MIFLAHSTKDPHNGRLAKHLGALCQLVPLAFGDFVFWGVWENKEPSSFCGEIKRTRDLITSIRSGHYLAQVAAAYERGFRRFFLLWEHDPPMRRAKNGKVELRGGRDWRELTEPPIDYREVSSFLDQLRAYFGIPVIETHTEHETAERIMDLYLTFQDAPEDHRSMKRFMDMPTSSSVYLAGPSLSHRVACQFQGVGFDKGRSLSLEFKSPLALLSASEKELSRVKGIGPKIARSVYLGARNGD